MANYGTLKSALDQSIKTNTSNSITGDGLNAALDSVIDSLGAGYQYMGLASPSTNPGTPDARVCYIANTAGTYTNFGNLVVADGEVAILKYGSSWSKDSILVITAITADDINEICT